jgi:hypothetical protein
VAPPLSPAEQLIQGKTIKRGRGTSETRQGARTGFATVLPPNDFESQWRTLNLDADTLSKQSAESLQVLLESLSDTMSKALWDWLRFCNPGYEIEVTTPDGAADEAGLQIVRDFFDLLALYYGSADVVINKLFHGAWTRGGFFMELVLGPDGMVDLATPDPATVRFRPLQDPRRGQVWEMGQLQGGTFVSLQDRPTILYVPVDPMPGNPYGSPIGSPGLFVSTFMVGLLRDLRRVVQQQGYEHMDIKVLADVLMQQAPIEVQSDPRQLKAWLDEAIAVIAAYYSSLEPDDAFVHLDAVEVSETKGAVNSNSMGGVGELLQCLERMAVRGLKSMPLLFGITDGVSEANANRQWEINTAGTKSSQHLCEDALSGLLTIGLRAAGNQSRCRITFAEVRGSEEYRDEQIRELRLQNALAMYLYGYATHAEASQVAVGHVPAVAAGPLLIPQQFVSPQDQATAKDTAAEPGKQGKVTAAATAKAFDPVEFAERFIAHAQSIGGTNGNGH